MFAVDYLYPSYFKSQVRWLSSLTPITYLSKLMGIYCVAAFLQLELFWVFMQEFRIIKMIKKSQGKI